jgi:hypothetical protein
MDVPEAFEQALAPFLFSYKTGYALCQHILEELLPYEPHDILINGVCNAFLRWFKEYGTKNPTGVVNCL